MTRLPVVKREEGIALIVALGILMVLSIMLTSIIYYTSSSSRDASRSHAGQKAYALAEAALNDAAAQIAANYYDASGTPTNTATAGSQSWISSSWTPTQQQQSPSSTAACTSASSCMQWTATWCAAPYTGPTCTALPTPPLTTKGTWLLTAKGTAPNPTGPTASPIVRTLQGKIDVSFDPRPPAIWQWIYGAGTTTIQQKATVKAPLWVRGNLVMQQSAAIEQPAGATGNRLAVGFDRTGAATAGNLDITNLNSQGHVGGDGSNNPPASTWLSEGHLSGSCLDSNGSYCKTNGGGRVWITGGLSSAAPTQTFPADTLQAADWQDRYANAAPGPNHSCPGGPNFDKNGVANGLNDDAGSFNLIGSSYNCTIDANDSIAYDATTHVLTVKGTIFFDGDLTISGSASYVGIANIYASGTIAFANNAVLCAKLSGSNCDWNGWNPNYDANSNPNPSILILAAESLNGGTSVTGTNVQFQGGLYGQRSIDLGGGSNTSGVQGPLVSPGVDPVTWTRVPSSTSVITLGQGAGTAFPVAGILAPGYPLNPYKLGSLYNQTG
jgi:hypothetical protein